MSKTTAPDIIIEWSPSEVSAWSRSSRSVRHGSTLGEVARGSSAAVIALARSVCIIRTLRVPNANRADLERILPNIAQNHFPLSLQEAAFDFMLSEDVNSEGRLAVVAAMPLDQYQLLRAEAQNAGLELASIIPIAFGSLLLAKKLNHRDAAVIETDAPGLGIDIVVNETLVYSRLASAAGDIQNELNRTFAAAGCEPVPPLSVGSAWIDAPETSTLTPLEALGDLSPTMLSFNLEPAQAKASRESKRRQSLRRQSGALLAAALVVAAFVGYGRYKTQLDVAASLKTSQSNLATYNKKLGEADKSVSDLQPVLTTLKRGFEPAQTFSDVITLLATDVPSGVWLNGITLEKGKALTLRGTALSSDAVTQYVAKLNSESRLRTVRLLFANNGTINNQSIVQFSISAFPVGNLPLMDKPTGA